MSDRTLTGCRRVVTGLDGSGKSSVMIDTMKRDVQTMAALPGFRWLDLWAVEALPGPVSNGDLADGAPIFPGTRGAVFRIFEIDPDTAEQADLYRSPDTHPLMNDEETLDLIYVMSGEIHVVFDGGETRLTAGDTFVQQGTRHAWSNRSDVPCRMLAVVVGGEKALG